MTGLSCNSCNKEFDDENDQKLHYKSEWHRYNLKRKIAGVPEVTEALFLARQSTLDEEKSRLNGPPMLYSCRLCGKGYRSAKAHAQHLKSRTHTMQASQDGHDDDNSATIKPLPTRIAKKSLQQKEEIDEESDGSDEWVEVTEDDDMAGDMASSSVHMEVNDDDDDDDEDMNEDEVDPTCCFMCDQEHKTIESCMVHMHKHHGFSYPTLSISKIQVVFSHILHLRLPVISYVCIAIVTANRSIVWKQLGNIWWQKVIAKYTLVMMMKKKKLN